MKDVSNRDIKVGDHIVYTVNTGSTSCLCFAQVDEMSDGDMLVTTVMTSKPANIKKQGRMLACNQVLVIDADTPDALRSLFV